MVFKIRKDVSDSAWKAAVAEKRVVGDRVYNTKKQAADAKRQSGGSVGKPTSPRSPVVKKPANPYMGWEAKDMILTPVANGEGFHYRLTIPTEDQGRFLIKSIAVTVKPGDATKLNWRYAMTKDTTGGLTLEKLIDAGCKGDHDVSYFKKKFICEFPQGTFEDTVPYPNFFIIAFKEVCDVDDESASFEVGCRYIVPKNGGASSSLVTL